MNIEQTIEEYLKGPQQLRDALRGMTAEQFDARPVPGRWSTRQVVAHIADTEPIYADRMKRVVAEDKPTLFGMDPDQYAASLFYDKRDIEEELQVIEAVRKSTGRLLRALPPEAFQRIGNHSEAGPLTLFELLERITRHIPHHIAFIEEKKAALAK